MSTPCLDAAIGEVHPAHPHVVPTGEAPGVCAVVWCEGVSP